MKRLWLQLFFVLAIIVTPIFEARAQGGFPSDDDVNRVAKKLYCPVCPNTPLDVCETQACQDWREEIRTQLAAGSSEKQVTAYFVERYGERVLAEPERGGFTSLVWILPLVALTVGLAVVVQALRSWRRRALETSDGDAPPAETISAPTRSRIERELEELL